MREVVTPIRTLVDGVPTFYVDVDGPFVATLAFRVGRADERLPSAGVTHLLEHLAMSTDDIRGVEAGASVGATWTLFWAQGPPDSVVAHLNAVVRNLAQLPLERLETERRILLTEAAGRGGPVGLGLAYVLRFGAGARLRPGRLRRAGTAQAHSQRHLRMGDRALHARQHCLVVDAAADGPASS